MIAMAMKLSQEEELKKKNSMLSEEEELKRAIEESQRQGQPQKQPSEEQMIADAIAASQASEKDRK